MKYHLPELKFPYDAFEPFIDKETMEVHHKGHHQAYIDKLNETLSGYPDFESLPLEELLATPDKLPIDIQDDVRNHGGGHFNHSLLWTLLERGEQKEPKNELGRTMKRIFGSHRNFKNRFNKCAIEHFGSGYVWLSVTSQGGLELESLPNQDTPLMKGYEPILLMDLWEHAYYLKHQNKRPEYVEAFWNVINWNEVEKRYNEFLIAESHLHRKAG